MCIDALIEQEVHMEDQQNMLQIHIKAHSFQYLKGNSVIETL